eukprot:gene13617-16573_t
MSTTVNYNEVVKKLGELVPLSLAEKWDNVGVLVEPSTSSQLNIGTIFLTNDLTEPVLQEAIEKKSDFIISYHPPLFNSFKTLNQKSVTQRIAIKAIENKIPIYSPHSALDSVPGGINDWISEGLLTLNGGKGKFKPIQPVQEVNSTSGSHQLNVYYEKSSNYQDLITALENINCKKKFINESNGQEVKLEFTCSPSQITVISELLSSKYIPISWNIQSNEKIGSNKKGQGRLVEFEEEVTIEQVIGCVKKLFGLQNVRLGKPLPNESQGKKIKTVALCAGSGGSLILGEKVDLYLTGELKHHEILDVCSKGGYVIVCDHSNSERGYLQEYKKKLNQLFNN